MVHFVYNYFRYYDPSTGRYITSDPIGLFGGLNTYGYVYANPLYWVDPYGLSGSFFDTPIYSSGDVLSWQTDQQVRAIEHQAELNSIPKTLKTGGLILGVCALAATGQEEFAIPLTYSSFAASESGVAAHVIINGKITKSDAIDAGLALTAVSAGPLARSLKLDTNTIEASEFTAGLVDTSHGLYGELYPESENSSTEGCGCSK